MWYRNFLKKLLIFDVLFGKLKRTVVNHLTDYTNPHKVTFTQAVTQDPNTDITAAEAEQLTNTSNADSLHYHFTPLNLEAGFTLPENYQYIVYGKLTVDETTILDGQLVIL